MNNRERILKIFNHEVPDRVPFMAFSELLPRGEFEREMRDRGMGLITHCTSLSSEMPNVETTTGKAGDHYVTVYRTPAGKVFTQHDLRNRSGGSGLQGRYLIKGIEDYRPVIFMIDDTNYHRNEAEFIKVDRELGGDGITHTWTDEPPYMDAQYYMGLEKWSYEQYDHPEEFRALLEALERRQDRRLKLLLDCPEQYLINLGNLAGNFGPQQYRLHMLPYFRKYARLFREKGKITTVHADALNLNEFKDIAMEHEVDVIEAFTPPPVGNLSLSDARKAWGKDVILHINFPESVFYEGYEKTKQYTVDLLKSDPCYRKFIGFTEMGLMSMDDGNRTLFQNGVEAIMDAIDLAGCY